MRRPMAAAVAVVLAGAALAGCSSGPVSGGGYHLTAWFEKAVSLYPSSTVRVLGLPAGRIDDVEAVGTRVRVTMTIDDDIPVPADVRATIIPLSLIGERYVQLFPAWTRGMARARDGDEIPLDRTSIPVEPDEALAAVKHLLDTLDPDAAGRLVKNLGEDLQGTGTDLNGALKGLGDLVGALGDKDDAVAAIIDNFDRFTAALSTRDRQLGAVLDGFASATGVLAEERRALEGLLRGLGDISATGLDLVSEHAAQLDKDLTVLTRTLQAAQANIEGVRNLLDAGGLLVAGPQLDGKKGLAAAHDEHFHHIDLRNSIAPTLSQLFEALGVGANTVCLPIDVNCTPAPVPAPASRSLHSWSWRGWR